MRGNISQNLWNYLFKLFIGGNFCNIKLCTYPHATGQNAFKSEKIGKKIKWLINC
jgi:hypothetical protein